MQVHRSSLSLILALVTLAGAPAALAQQDVLTQPAPLASRMVAFEEIDSGQVAHPGTEPGAAVVFSAVVAADDSTWIRLEFDEVRLSGSREGGNTSFLRITSLTDGHAQILDRVGIVQWKLTSAYFNGDAVLVELVAYPGTGSNRVRMSRAVASEPEALPRSICGTTDDRVLSYDNRSARVLPVGCTGWTISDCNSCMLTAGHCQGGLSVIQFNVPLSSSSGSIRNPPPEDQYAVDSSSVQGNGGAGVGNDWAYYGVFPNSNTGLTPYQAYGVAHNLVLPPPASGNARVTGYGTTSSPVSPTWNQVQKTHAGAYTTFSGTSIGYRMDTTGGNSGSPVIHETTGNAIGIHTHGGCTSTGGNNWGTGANHAALQAALASPKGVCECPGPDFVFSGEFPAYVAPSGGTTIEMQITTVNGISPVSGSGKLHIDIGSGFFDVPMTDDGAGAFVAMFPPIPCTTPVAYTFSVIGTDGKTYSSPREGMSGTPYAAISAYGIASVVELDFETDDGWTVENVALIRGAWERGVPAGGGLNRDPGADFDGSGQCWVTGNAAGDADVDGGPTRLISPAYDLSGLDDPKVTFARWHSTNNLPNDQFVTEISNDNGATWVPVSSVGNNGNSWKIVSFDVTDYVALTSTVRVRFSVADNPDNSTTESAIDAFSISDLACSTCDADANGDGEVDVLDFLDFLDAFGACDGLPSPCSGSSGVDADFNADTIVDVLDLLDFLDAFGRGC